MFPFEWKLINKFIIFFKIYLVYMSLHCYNEMYVLYICICMCLCMLVMKYLTIDSGREYNLKVISVHIRKILSSFGNRIVLEEIFVSEF